MHRSEYKHSRWGIMIVDAQSGQTIYAVSPDRLFIPASTTKLFSCATALTTLGPDYRFETPVFVRGVINKGILEGDLILVASGDLTMGGRNKEGKTLFENYDHTYANGGSTPSTLTPTDPLYGLNQLAEQISKKGIKEITGEILIDERLFPRFRSSGSGPEIVSSIMINDNLVDVTVIPASKPNELARVEMRPKCDLIQMDAEVKTTEENQPPKVIIQAMNSTQFTIRGTIPVKHAPINRFFPIEEPSLFARNLFIRCLREKGILVHANALRPSFFNLPPKGFYPKLNKIASYESEPFRDVIKVTLKVSHNLYASTLPALVGLKKGDPTPTNGLRIQKQILTDLGVDANAISFGGGAGGTNSDLVSPREIIHLLQGMAKRPEATIYFDSLPVMGLDGTLVDTVSASSPARGKVQAKTGTFIWFDLLNNRPMLRSKSIAGKMTTAKNRSLYFAIFLNDVAIETGGSPARESKALGEICELIYNLTPASPNSK